MEAIFPGRTMYVDCVVKFSFQFKFFTGYLDFIFLFIVVKIKLLFADLLSLKWLFNINSLEFFIFLVQVAVLHLN